MNSKVVDPTTGKKYWGDPRNPDDKAALDKFERHHRVKAVPIDPVQHISKYPGPEPAIKPAAK